MLCRYTSDDSQALLGVYVPETAEISNPNRLLAKQQHPYRMQQQQQQQHPHHLQHLQQQLGAVPQSSSPRATSTARLLAGISCHPLILQLADHDPSQAQNLGQMLQQGGAAMAKQLAMSTAHLAGQLQELAVLQEQDEAVAGALAARLRSSAGVTWRRAAGAQQQQPAVPLV
jgi:hypothetical protein